MYINPELEIRPLGFHHQPGRDDVIRFKFAAMTDDPSELFDSSQVDHSAFSRDFGVYALDPKASDPWWDLAGGDLAGGNFSAPPPHSTGSCGLNIGYTEEANGTLTVYVLWHET